MIMIGVLDNQFSKIQSKPLKIKAKIKFTFIIKDTNNDMINKPLTAVVLSFMLVQI